MMGGWIVMLLLSALVFGLLCWFAPERRRLWTVVAATITLALAGYAVQGSPELSSAPAHRAEQQREAIDSLLTMRADMDQRFSSSRQWLILSDSFARSGKYGLAAASIQSGLRKNPRDGDLWAALGVLLMVAGDGEYSAPAKLAFAKARNFSPRHPAPDYFEGLSFLFKGDAPATLEKWNAILAAAPKQAKWKPQVESQILGLQKIIAAEQVPPLPEK